MITWNMIEEIMHLIARGRVQNRTNAFWGVNGEDVYQVSFEKPDPVTYTLALPRFEHTNPMAFAYEDMRMSDSDRIVSMYTHEDRETEVRFSMEQALEGGPVQLAVRNIHWSFADRIPLFASLILYKQDMLPGVMLGSHLAFPDFVMTPDKTEDSRRASEVEAVVVPLLPYSVTGLSQFPGSLIAYDETGWEPMPYAIAMLGGRRNGNSPFLIDGYGVAVEPGTRIGLDGEVLSGELYEVKWLNNTTTPWPAFDPSAPSPPPDRIRRPR
jgi:hypothetical protein